MSSLQVDEFVYDWFMGLNNPLVAVDYLLIGKMTCLNGHQGVFFHGHQDLEEL